MADLNPVIGREQAGVRPVLVISVDPFNHGPAELIVVIPITSKDKGIPLHVAIAPPEGRLSVASFVKCEDVRSISKGRLTKRRGAVERATMEAIEDRLRLLLGL
jgi:mRNA interferase MazF